MAGVDPGAPVCDSWRSDVGWITTILSSADPQLTLEADPGIGVQQSSTSTTLFSSDHTLECESPY